MSTAVAPRSTTRQRLASAPPAAPPSSGIAFCLFLAVNATLFVRPAEFIPDLHEINIFLFLILASMALAFPTVLHQFSPGVLDRRPITTCVLGLLMAAVLSHLAHSRLVDGVEKAWDFFKVVVYFLLLISLVDTPKRLRTFVLCTLFCASLTVLLAVLDFNKVIALPKIERSLDHPEHLAVPDDTRLSGSGLFQDPNDLCMLVATAVPLCLYALTDAGSGPFRVLWLGPLGLFLYGFTKTGSRGGLIALVAGLGAFMRARYGWGKTLLLGAAGVPLLAVVVGGRQAEISTRTGTAHQRIQIWSDGLEHFRGAPVFGIGVGEFDKQSDHVAHNSYLQAFAEMGVLGGLLFIGAVYLPLSALLRLCRKQTVIVDPEMRRLHPYVLGAVAAYAAGMLTLTLCYVMPTYTVLGLGAAFLGIVVTRPVGRADFSAASIPVPVLVEKFDVKLVLRLAGVGVCFLISIYVFVRVFRG